MVPCRAGEKALRTGDTIIKSQLNTTFCTKKLSNADNNDIAIFVRFLLPHPRKGALRMPEQPVPAARGISCSVICLTSVLVAWPSRSKASGQVLAMTHHGQDARGTPLVGPIGIPIFTALGQLYWLKAVGEHGPNLSRARTG